MDRSAAHRGLALAKSPSHSSLDAAERVAPRGWGRADQWSAGVVGALITGVLITFGQLAACAPTCELHADASVEARADASPQSSDGSRPDALTDANSNDASSPQPSCAAACGPQELCVRGACVRTCGLSTPTGDDTFVEQATQWRMATYLYWGGSARSNVDAIAEQMQWLRDRGFNAITIPVAWNEIEPDEDAARTGSKYPLLGVLLDRARALGFSVRLNVWLRRWDGGEPDRAPQDTQFLRREDISRAQDGSYDGEPQLSYHAPRIENATRFIERVLRYVRPWHNEGVLRWYSVIVTQQAELGYSYDHAGDYNDASRAAFSRWLFDRATNPRPHADLSALNGAWSTTYASAEQIEPPSVGAFSSEGRRGEDWWRFREHSLRAFLARVRATLDRTIDAQWTRPVRLINDYGSVYDHLSRSRQSFDFVSHLRALGPYGYGVKQNGDANASADEQRFAMELLTSQVARLGGVTFNEAFDGGLPIAQWADQVQAWLEAGANGYSLYTAFGLDAQRSRVDALVAELTRRGVWGGGVRCRSERSTLTYTATTMLRAGWNGERSGRPSLFNEFLSSRMGGGARFVFENDLWP